MTFSENDKKLINYFTETEEYEKCAELVKIKQTIN